MAACLPESATGELIAVSLSAESTGGPTAACVAQAVLALMQHGSLPARAAREVITAFTARTDRTDFSANAALLATASAALHVYAAADASAPGGTAESSHFDGGEEGVAGQVGVAGGKGETTTATAGTVRVSVSGRGAASDQSGVDAREARRIAAEQRALKALQRAAGGGGSIAMADMTGR